ncbi:DUF3383 domain-containing protein [Beijerinckia sp. L45]|uniref:DUF3383 domain-containing protein n=1 Tax=Beijerinckia sp. L45 TaxID=1641855 RepID=UPI00131C92CA|nr:DUF3383 domain-containing protein [Beijerinckia sp. L45]
MATPNGLNTNDVVDVTISLTNTPAGFRNFGAVLVLGPSDVIDVNERRRNYSDMTGVGADFAPGTPEFAYAEDHFSQVPQPNQLAIGRFAQTATAGLLHGAILTPSQRLLTNFTSIGAGGAFKMSIDGTVHPVGPMNFSGAANLNGVAGIVQAALVTAGATGATVVWDSENLRFNVESGTTGAASSVGYATAPTAGAGVVDVSVLLGLSATPTSSGAAADAPIAGIVAEEPLACIALFDQLYGDWYMGAFAATLADADHLSVAEYIEAAGRSRIYGIGTENTEVMDPTQTDDLASILVDANISRTCIAYSSTTTVSIASLFARFATVNYAGSNTTITGKFKTMPGVTAEYLTEDQAETLDAKRVNYFAAYQNGASIIQQAVMVNGNFIDSRINADWLANYVQTNLFNLYTTMNKVPQTDAGTGLQKANITASMQQGIVNGYLAAGVWNGQAFGTLNTGDVLPLGFYIYAPLVATQNQTDRAARKSVPFQIAAKEAGAVHSSSISILVNP